MLVLVAVPDSERALGLTGALADAGRPFRVVDWAAVAADPGAVALRPGELLRVDSPGDDPALRLTLERLGGGAGAPLPFGAWRGGRAFAAGLDRVLSALPDGTHPAWSVRMMTDKHAARDHLTAAGLPVPPGDLAPSTPAALRAWLDDRGWSQAFVKPRWGSSGAGIFAWRRARGRELARTTLRFVDGVPTLAKRLHQTADSGEIDALMAPVLADGAIVERWIPKIGAGDRCFDLRVVLIDGEPALRVARLAAGPITNLHLDARRADPADLLPPSTLAAVDDLARRAAAAFPGHRTWGLDVLIDPDHRALIGECNAWGDNVRRVRHDGLDAWTLQVRALYPSEP